MAFEGPEAADYDNVVSLNRAWLSLLQSDTDLGRGLAGLPETLRRRITNLSERQIARLAATPFLLFSFREGDDRHWTRILSVSPGRDLFSSRDSEEVDTLISAGLGFVWQLARRNPYAVRLICGATLYWSERIAELTFIDLLDAVRAAGDVPVIRSVQQHQLWQKLLDSGVSSGKLACQAAQMSALQVILTDPADGRQETWSVAARKANAPRLQVAEENETTQD